MKEQLKLMAEKNVHLETSLNEVKEKNQNLQHEIDQINVTSNNRLRTLQDSLSDKTNEVNLLKERLDIKTKEHQACKKELNETKNQLYYKHLALDGIIKSNIKLQEQHAAAVLAISSKQSVKKSSTSQTAVSRADDVSKLNIKQSTTLACADGKKMNKATQQTAVSLQTNETDVSVTALKNGGSQPNDDVAMTITLVAQKDSPNNKKQNRRRRRNKKRFE